MESRMASRLREETEKQTLRRGLKMFLYNVVLTLFSLSLVTEN